MRLNYLKRELKRMIRISLTFKNNKRSMEQRVTPKEIIELVRRLSDAESYIHKWNGKQCITQEWLCGNFAGRLFEADKLEDAAQEMIEYLYKHIGHESMVGRCVTDSGFPDLKKVEQYCTRLEAESELYHFKK